MKHNTLTVAFGIALIGLALPSCLSDDSYNPQPTPGYPTAGTPRVRQVQNGSFIVAYPGGGTASFNPEGQFLKQSDLTPYQVREAQRAVDAYRREQSGSDHHSGQGGYPHGGGGAPVVRPRSDGKLEVQMPAGGVVLYDQNGRFIQKGASVTQRDLGRANRAVQSYLREQ